MLKKIQFKIVLIFFLVVVISLISVTYMMSGYLTSLEENVARIEEIKQEIKVITVVLITIITIVTLIGYCVLSRYVIYPVNKLIKSAESDKKKQSKEKKNPEAAVLELTEQLREISTQKNQIETILLNITDGIIAFNMKGEKILVNPVAKNMLEVAPEDMSFDQIFKKHKIDMNMEKMIYLKDWTTTETKIEIEDKYLKLVFAPFKNQEKQIVGVITLVHDITESEKLGKMQREFIADVSHELKTPITSIMGYSDTLKEGECDEETTKKFLEVISGEAGRMGRLVTDLLVLSRYDSQKTKTRKEEFDVGELVKKCHEKLAIEVKKKEQNVECFVTADVPSVYANKDDIERVVLNILSNSIKYTPVTGQIKIYVGFVHNHAYIKVIDDGLGIPKADLARIFERFYRVEKARTREMGGTGLGLAIAKEILDKNAGSIDIKSSVGKGTEVIIKLPITKKSKKVDNKENKK